MPKLLCCPISGQFATSPAHISVVHKSGSPTLKKYLFVPNCSHVPGKQHSHSQSCVDAFVNLKLFANTIVMINVDKTEIIFLEAAVLVLVLVDDEQNISTVLLSI